MSSHPDLHLRAGPLRADLVGADLRGIRIGDRVLLDRIYAPVRDAQWLTVPARILRRRLVIRPAHFAVDLVVEHRAPGIRFLARLAYRGEADGTITARFHGLPRRHFLRQRIGFCLHHPATMAGSLLRCRHGRRAEQDLILPQLPAPWQPVDDLIGLSWRIPGWMADCSFTGEVFEMEDQRQWGDWSFKTYGTPLALPRPVPVVPGQAIVQGIRLSVVPEPGAASGATPATPVAGLRRPRRLGTRWAGRVPTSAEDHLLRGMPIRFLRCDLDLGRDWSADLRSAAAVATASGWGMELALVAESIDDTRLAALAAHLTGLGLVPECLLVLDAAERSDPSAAERLVATRFSAIPRGCGTRLGFTEVNRGRPPVPSGGWLAFRINACEHADDDRSLIENLPTGRLLVAAARAIAPNAGVEVGPVWLASRTGQPDRRWDAGFGARWLAATLDALAEADRVVVGDLTGPRGLVDSGRRLQATEALD